MSTAGPVTPGEHPQPLQGLTVTCQQCGAANMTRLGRKEYKCNHCGAVTVISDTDADRLEQLLKQMLARQAVATAQPATRPGRKAVALIAAGVVSAVAAVTLLSTRTNRPAFSPASVDSYLATSTVPPSRITLSPLEWIPHGTSGVYEGLIYNHSGYAIDLPSFKLAIFHGTMKDGDADSTVLGGTLEPGEYLPVSFTVANGKPGLRYEVVAPDRIDRTNFEVAPVRLNAPTLFRNPVSALQRFYVVGTVRNTLKRPIITQGTVMFYGSDGRLVGSAYATIPELNPGEESRIVMQGSVFHPDAEIASYEYLIDAFYKNERSSVSMQDEEAIHSATVPNRIVRVDHPSIALAPTSITDAP